MSEIIRLLMLWYNGEITDDEFLPKLHVAIQRWVSWNRGIQPPPVVC